ncbi:MAG: hypothetical protein ACI9ES_001841 [Oceanospirillaceae bacterium]|jgi:hypothetical protein
MQPTALLNKNTILKRIKKRLFTQSLMQRMYAVGPVLVLLFLILGVVFEFAYWKKILWLLVY